MNEDHFAKLERMYLNTKINVEIFPSTTVKIAQGKAEIAISVNENYFHALGAIHGSIYFKLLDDAAFFAVNSVVKDFFVLTTSFNTQLVRPVSSGRIYAKGELKFQSKNLFIAEATLYNEQDREVGFGTGNFMKSRTELTPNIGYA